MAKMMLTQSDLDLCGILGHVMEICLCHWMKHASEIFKSVIECGSVVNILVYPRFSKTYFNPFESMSMNLQLIYNEVGPKYNAPVMAENLLLEASYFWMYGGATLSESQGDGLAYIPLS